MRKRSSFAPLVLLLFVLVGCGGPSEKVIIQAIGELAQQPGLEEFVELENLSVQECSLTDNEKTSKSISERWIARFSMVVKSSGEVDDTFKAAVLERTQDGHWYINPFKFGC